MYIRRLSLKHLRCFKEAKLTFQYPGRVAGSEGPPTPTLPNVNLLLGNNGAGKSTILKAIAMVLVAPVLKSSGLRPYSLVRRIFQEAVGAKPVVAEVRADVILTGQDGCSDPKEKKLSVKLRRIGDSDVIADSTAPSGEWTQFFDDGSPAFLILGYGTGRVIAPAAENISRRVKETHLRYQRVRGLFEDISLVPLSHWFPAYDNKGRKKQLIALIDKLMGDLYKFEGDVEGGELLFRRGEALVPLPALSDGYRAFLGWIGDLLYHVCIWAKSGKRLDETEGVVIVDEIDLHLHPEWQRTIIKTLATTFPKIQFILSSHSPLLTGSLEWSNIWVMGDGAPTQLPDEPISGLSADQVLLSPYFGITSTRSDEKLERLAKLEQQVQQGDPFAGRKFMQELTLGMEAVENSQPIHPHGGTQSAWRKSVGVPQGLPLALKRSKPPVKKSVKKGASGKAAKK